MREIGERYLRKIYYNLKTCALWLFMAGLTGVGVGAFSSAFSFCLKKVTMLRGEYPFLLYFLPAGGIVIILLYHLCGVRQDKGTNIIMTAVHGKDQDVPAYMAPLIFAATIITHLFGGSAGREGAALQMGASIGNTIGRLFKFEEGDRKLLVMSGMSAAFSAVFGTPLAAAIFPMEMISVGIMHYAALVPCLFSSLIGAGISGKLGLSAEHFTIVEIPEFGLKPAVLIIVLGILCALISMTFCVFLHEAEHWYRRFFKNPYIRILAASLILIGLTLVTGTRAYNGSSMGLIEQAIEGHVPYEAFFLKAVFTAVTLGAGYKGGEIVPTLCVGATFGCAVGMLLGFSPSLCAACGMIALFAGVTNCPVSSILIAFEMCGFEAMPYFALAVAVSFTLSGYYGLYKSQKFIYSKIRTEFINRKAN